MDTAVPVLDSDTLAALRELATPDQPDFLKQLLELFVQTSPSRVQTIQKAATAGELMIVAREAHVLKSSSANIGALELSLICQNLEKAARSTSPASVLSEIARLQPALDAVLVEIARLPEMK